MQNEDCFADLADFYKSHIKVNAPPRPPSAKGLYGLIIKLSARFQTTMIIVDGLDEIAKDRADVAQLLRNLYVNSTSVKTLFASRLEVDIGHVLEDFVQVSIAARSSDLRLYVAAEIESRTAKNKLKIRDPSLTEHIIKRLTEGADGM